MASYIPSGRSITVFHYPECSKVVLERSNEQNAMHVETVKGLVGEKRGLKKESLVIFGIFLGSPDNPLQLLLDRVPKQAMEVSMLRMSLEAHKEEDVIENDPIARLMVFCELKKLYRCDHLLPTPEGKINLRIKQILGRTTSSDSEKELIRIITRNFYTYTSRNNLVTSPQNIAKRALSLSRDVIPIKVAVGLTSLVFYDISGGKVLMSWPLVTLISIRQNYKYVKAMVFYIAVSDSPTKKVLRPIYVISLSSDYLETVCAYMKSNLQHCGISHDYSDHYPYLLQKVSANSNSTITRIESHHLMISIEMDLCLSTEGIRAFLVSIMDDCMYKPLSAFYYPRKKQEFEAAEGVSVRTFLLTSKTDQVKVQIPIYYGRKVRVKDLLHCLCRHYCLVSLLHPEELFQVYDLASSGATVRLASKSILPSTVDKLCFRRLPQKKCGNAPLKLNPTTNRVSFKDEEDQDRQNEKPHLHLKHHNKSPPTPSQ